MKDLKKIVILRTDRIGEVLLSTVAVSALKERYPSSGISFVTSEYSRPLLEERQDIECIFTTDTFDKKSMLKKAFKLAGKLKKERFDAAIILNPHKMLHLACFLARIPLRAGYDRKWGFLLNLKIEDKRTEGRKHEVQYTMDLLQMLDVNTNEIPDPYMAVGPSIMEKIDKLMIGEGRIEERPLISIHSGSSNPSKLWPLEKYAELIQRISSDLDCDIAVLGSKDEKPLTGALLEKLSVKVLDLSGKMDLKDLAAVLKGSSLFIGNDAGPMHMAAALKVSSVAIFGKTVPGTNPARWRPWGRKNIIFHETQDKDPFMGEIGSGEYICLPSVSVDAVFDAVKRMLSAEGRAHSA